MRATPECCLSMCAPLQQAHPHNPSPTPTPRPHSPPFKGITVNQLQSCSGGSEALPPASILPAVLCVAGSVTVPSAASVYNEFALKKHMDTSVHLQNFFLYFYGACFNLLGVLGVCLFKGQGLGELFGGQSRVTAVLIVNNAAQVRVVNGRCGVGGSCDVASRGAPVQGAGGGAAAWRTEQGHVGARCQQRSAGRVLEMGKGVGAGPWWVPAVGWQHFVGLMWHELLRFDWLPSAVGVLGGRVGMVGCREQVGGHAGVTWCLRNSRGRC